MRDARTIVFTPAGQALFERIVHIWPPIIRETRSNKIRMMIDLLAGRRTLRHVDEALVIEAARLVVPKSYDPLFDMFQDMAAFKKRMLEPFVSEKAYAKIPVRVRRWKPAPRRGAAGSGRVPRVLAFCASPRRGGNTDRLVDEALAGAADGGAQTEKIMLHAVRVGYCIGCRKCKEPGYEKICVIKDDMAEIYQKIIGADALIIGFPIYTGRECAQLSTFLDRWDGFERHMLSSCLEPGRTALVIGTWGYPSIDTYDHVIENIISILNLHKVETVEALSACGFEGLRHGLDRGRSGVSAKHPVQLRKARAAGKALAGRFLKKT